MARPTFAGLVRSFRAIQRSFDQQSIAEQEKILLALSSMPCGTVTAVMLYHEALLYSAAYPGSNVVRTLAEIELQRVALHVSTRKGADRLHYENSTIAGAPVRVPFSLTLNKWLVERFPEDTQLSTEGVNESVLVQTLVNLFDPVEQEMLHAGKTAWAYWSEHMTGAGGNKQQMKRWIVEMTDRLPGSTALKEFIFGQFATTTLWSTHPNAPTLTSGRANHGAPFIHTHGLQRSVDLTAHLASKPRRIDLTLQQQTHLVDVARGVLASMQRETDPVTFSHVGETEYYDMGRGLGIALYAMQPDMKMALQSYIGFMAFKNDVPCAYGGGWVLNNESFFGVNVFPPFRGGESAVIVADLLRLYHHAFNVRAFCVDPYQIGYGNSDGIKSRSFWFYYRLGFRPVEKDLAKLARDEYKKMSTTPGYHSPKDVLLTLAGATMRWVYGSADVAVPPSADRLGDLVTKHVNSCYDGDRQAALRDGLRKLNARTKKRYSASHPIARIVVLLHASGYLDRATPARLNALADDYRLKSTSERMYVLRSQRYHALFDALGVAERTL
ncbi:MAG: hypothetical protein IPF79_09920 [Ignavibacteria bacterium]|nr:hypothetical protein [Ignavibacteria bacterium]